MMMMIDYDDEITIYLWSNIYSFKEQNTTKYINQKYRHYRNSRKLVRKEKGKEKDAGVRERGK